MEEKRPKRSVDPAACEEGLLMVVRFVSFAVDLSLVTVSCVSAWHSQRSNVLSDVGQTCRVCTCFVEGLDDVLPLWPSDVLLRRAQIPDDEESKLVFSALELLALDVLENLGLVLLHDVFFQLEETVQLPILDSREKRGEDVHVHIQNSLSFSQCGEQGNGGFEVLRAGACVVLQVLEIRHTPFDELVRFSTENSPPDLRLGRDCRRLLLVLRQFRVDIFSDLREW